MKNFLIAAILSCLFVSCQKDKLTRATTWVNITYRIQSYDSNLQLNLMRGVYTDAVKGNIAKDTLLKNPGYYYIPASVLINERIYLFAMSTTGPNFYLSINDKDGNVLNKTNADSIRYHPITSLDTFEKWTARISIIPK